MGQDDITCKEFLRTLAEFLAGQLDDRAARRSDLHRQACPDCARYLQDYEATIRMARDAEWDPADGGNRMPSDLADVILSARRRRN